MTAPTLADVLRADAATVAGAAADLLAAAA
ncbi:MAG: hypothetical protein AVDCRST_MAG79-182, partial [uncultured Thermoleophilia bacterium]